jgi:glutathione S-transferase
MKLYSNPASPFVRKVCIFLHECGMTDAVEMVAATGHPTDRGTMPVAVNPLGKLPTLERADGAALYDSRVICRYIDETSGTGLYPPAPRLWETLTLEATGDGIMDAAVLMVYETRSRAEDRRDPAWVEAQWGKVVRALDALEGRWMSHLKGPLDAGQIAVGCALGYLDFRHGGRDWRTGRPELTAWYERFSARDAMRATAPKG